MPLTQVDDRQQLRIKDRCSIRGKQPRGVEQHHCAGAGGVGGAGLDHQGPNFFGLGTDGVANLKRFVTGHLVE